MSNVEINGSTRKRRIVVGRFSSDPNASSILYTMRDPNPDRGVKKAKANDVKDLEHQLPYAEHLETVAEIRQDMFTSVGVEGADNVATDTTACKKGGSSEAVYSQRYNDAMEALLKPVSSKTLLYEPHLVPESKNPPKKKVKSRSTQESAPQSRTEKNLAKKVAEFKSFPQNVRTLTATGMLDGAAVQYQSTSKEKQLRGIINGPSYFCGCKLCNFSKAVNAYEFESHAGCKTSHPNNHIHLENKMTIHSVVQELKKTTPDRLCDAIQTVLGPSLNREAFCSWKESFEAARRQDLASSTKEKEKEQDLASSTKEKEKEQDLASSAEEKEKELGKYETCSK